MLQRDKIYNGGKIMEVDKVKVTLLDENEKELTEYELTGFWANKVRQIIEDKKKSDSANKSLRDY